MTIDDHPDEMTRDPGMSHFTKTPPIQYVDLRHRGLIQGESSGSLIPMLLMGSQRKLITSLNADSTQTFTFEPTILSKIILGDQQIDPTD